MSDPPKRILKINTSGISRQGSEALSSALPQSTPKIKLTSKARFAGVQAQEPELAASPNTKLKLKFPTKPKPDAAPTSKKRDHDKAEGNGSKTVNSGKKKLRLSFVKKATVVGEEPQSATVTTPFVRFKVKEKFRKKAKLRKKGYAYDSEASDREAESIQQWNFILRMPPGEDAEWIRNLIDKRELEKNRKLLKLRFLHEDGRRAMLTVRGKTYAAILVDLPCVIESMKGWDRKGWYKSADIHQMLLVLGTVVSEDEALKFPLPKGELNEKTWAYAHGLTPPMHWVRKRRFRKRISTHAIQDIEESVRRLLEKDALAVEDVQYEVLDKEVLRRQEDAEDDYYEDEDGEGEFEDDAFNPDAFGEEAAQDDDEEEEEEVDQDAFEAQFKSFLGGAEDVPDTQEIVETPGSSNAAAFEVQNGTESEIGTPGAVGSKATSDDDDDNDEDEDDEEDESEKEERVGFERAREEISELESAIKEQLAEMDRVGNPLLKTRIRNKIQALQADLELKKAAVGDEDDDDDDD